MKALSAYVRHSVSVKAATIAVLVLILLIPIGMIENVIQDRTQVGAFAEADIMRSWGGAQVVAGPILVLPYRTEQLSSYGVKSLSTGRAYVLPGQLGISADIVPDERYRGIHKVPVYTANVRLSGRFGKPDLDGLGISSDHIEWDRAYFALAVEDARAITRPPEIDIADRSIRFVLAQRQISGMPAQIAAPAKDLFGDVGDDTVMSFDLKLSLKGTKDLQFLPFGDTTTVTMTSAWPSPSFFGSHLPMERTVDDTGFSARWQISSLGRALPSSWVDGADEQASARHSAFGVGLYTPIGLYQLSLRATKYAALFVVLSFAAYFLFEVIAGLRLHPLQYLLVGFANTLFFLLLLSLAEHIGFGWAYLVSAIASSGLISAYSVAVLEQRRRAAIVAVVLGLLYGFLYMTLRAETYAMLVGSVFLWASLGSIMYMTRRVDWYGREEVNAP